MPKIKVNKVEPDPMITDENVETDSKYLLGRQVAHEYYSEPVQFYLHMANQQELERQQQANLEREKTAKTPEEREYTKQQIESFPRRKAEESSQLATQAFERMHEVPSAEEPLIEQEPYSESKKIEAELGGLEAPMLDPTAAAAAGFGGGFAVSLAAGKAIMPSLARALTSGVVGGLADYPLGAATQVLEVEAPQLAMPFNIAVGLLSGVTLENAIERGIIKAATRAGQKFNKTKLKEMVQIAKRQLSNEFGQVGVWREPLKQYQEFISKNPKASIEQIIKETGLTRYQVENLKELSKLNEPIINSVINEVNIEIGKTPVNQLTDLLRSQRGSIEIEGKKTKSGIPKPPDMKAAAEGFIAKKPAEIDITQEMAGNIRMWGANLEPKFMSDIESPEDIMRVIKGTHEAFSAEQEAARRGVRTWEETKEASKQYRLADLLGRKIGQAFSAEEIENARTMLVSSSETLKAMGDKVKSGLANDAEKLDFMRAFNLNYAIQMQLSGAAAEAGRALNIFRKVAKSDVLRTAQIGEFLTRASDKRLTPENLALALSEMDSPSQVNAFVKQARRATSWDMLVEAWINGLLSGPITHAVNTTSNALVALWAIPERTLAVGIGRMTGSDAIRAGEVATQTRGLVEGFKDGLKAAGMALKTGVSADVTSKLETSVPYRSITAENISQLPLIKKLSPDALEKGGAAARAVDALGEIIRGPGRFLTAEDDFFKAIGYRMELNAQAYRKAVSEGLEGDELTRRIAEIKADPGRLAPEIHLAAIDAARYQTFTNPTGPAVRGIQQTVNNSKIGKVILPFVRTPANILKFATQRTVLGGALDKELRQTIIKGFSKDATVAEKAAKDLALARISLGSMAMAVVGAYAAAGHITGGGPTDTGLRSHLYNQGWQPYSIKIGDKYYSYGRLEPLGMMMGLAADYVEIAGELSELEGQEAAIAIVKAFSKNVLSKTWLRGISETITALDDPERYGSKWVQRLTGTVVPTGIAQIERSISPEMSEVQSIMDSIKSRIPGYSKDLPPRRNLWGEKILLSGGLGPDFVSPIYTSKAKDSPIDKELIRLKRPIRMPSRIQTFSGQGYKLNPKEYDDFIVKFNEVKIPATRANLKKSLDYLVTKDRDYKMASDEVKFEMIQSHITTARELARHEFLAEHPQFQLLIDLHNQIQAAAAAAR